MIVQLLYVGVAAVAVGIVAYNVWGTEASRSIPSVDAIKKKVASPKAPAYTPKGDVQTWSDDDMEKFLKARNMMVGHNPSRDELIAMVMSKLNEPTETGFDDPAEWSAEELRQYLVKNKMDPGHHASRMELLAMVESKMHEPK